jgi:hypothetical protein
MSPRDAYTIADFKIIDGLAFLYYAAYYFVTRNQRTLDDSQEMRPVALGDVQV